MSDTQPTSAAPPGEGRRRVVIEGVSPEIDAGRFPAKRSVGEDLVVEADVFADGHDLISCVLRYRAPAEGTTTPDWSEKTMLPLGNDRWRGSFPVGATGIWRYTIKAWIDRFGTWRSGLEKKLDGGLDVSVELLTGAGIVDRAAKKATGDDKRLLKAAAEQLGRGDVALALSAELSEVMDAHADRTHATTYDRELEVIVDRERARTGAWYEMFPRSAGSGGEHGSFADVRKRLGYVAGMGFDVLYLPPIHPIGTTHRKGPNNTVLATSGDPGSPWAIGSPEGGHTAIHPQLGTMQEFADLVADARDQGLEIALDLAYQCSPDHPWVREHPEWFRTRPDGSIQYAENPPKKYQDIYPLDFETPAWKQLWTALRDVIEFWVSHGVQIFRVDNPHTKSFSFWEWCIADVKSRHPDVLFLSEAFTRPRVMYRLAKLGFTQSYTYFAWRTTKRELTEYLTELTSSPVRDFFRPSFWPNTPDILTEQLQIGGRPAFITRLVLAATLSANYGIYGPAFELMEHVPAAPGAEEYLHSEKYEVRDWDLWREDSLAEIIAIVNRARHEHPALQTNDTLRFHEIGNDALLAYSKADPRGDDVVLTVVNLDPLYTQSGWVDLPLDELGLDPGEPYHAHDLVTGSRYLWQGPRNYVELNPAVLPAHLFALRSREPAASSVVG